MASSDRILSAEELDKEIAKLHLEILKFTGAPWKLRRILNNHDLASPVQKPKWEKELAEYLKTTN